MCPSQVWHGSEYRNRLERQNTTIPTYLTATCPPGATDEDDLATFNSCFRCPTNGTTTNVTSVPGFGEHWGCTPVDAFPTAEVPPSSNPRQVADTHNFWVKFPPKMQEKNPKEPVRVCPR